MNKKLVAIAVAGALSAPATALAQVTIGGGLNLLYFSHDPDNKSVASTGDVMQSSESELRISGTEKLGGGLEVWFQCATSIDGIFNGNTATTAGMCTRNSALGFKGGFGNVFAGNWDTPLKLVQNRIRGWFSGTNALYGGGYTLLAGGASSGGSAGAANGQGNTSTTGVVSAVGTAGTATAQFTTATGGTAAYSFYRRQANSLNYESPNWGGFSVGAAMSASNESQSIPDSMGLTPRLFGINGVYAAGPFWVGVGYEVHQDYNPGATTVGTGASQYNGGTDSNYTIGAGYTFAGTVNVRASYSSSKYDVTSSGDLKVKGYNFYGDWQIAGPHALHLAYIVADDTKGSTGQSVGSYKGPSATSCGGTGTTLCSSSTGGKVYTIAYSYDFSKRTQMLFAYNEMKNDSNSTFNMGVAAATPGAKQKSIGLGVRHSF